MIRELTQSLDIISALENEPNDEGGLTASELKAKFDESGNAIKSYINGTLIPDVSGAIREEVGAAVVAAGNMPSGGSEGQVVVKNSDADYDLRFSDMPTSADTLTSARTIRTNLSSADAAGFDGSADVEPGVTGVLPSSNGGTGANNPGAAALSLGRGVGSCSTPAATAAKVVAMPGFSRVSGSIAGVTFTYANTAANPTLNVNGTGAAAITDGETGDSVAALRMFAGTHLFQFDGTSWLLLNPWGPAYVSGEILNTAVTSQPVTLGFQPSAVMLHNYHSPAGANYSQFTMTFANLILNTPKVSRFRVSGTETFQVTATATGFTYAYSDAGALNTAGYTRYIAFK